MAKCSNCGSDFKNVVYFNDICLCSRCISYVPQLFNIKGDDTAKLIKLYKKKYAVLAAMRGNSFKTEVIDKFSEFLEGYSSEEKAKKSAEKQQLMEKQRYEDKFVNSEWPKIVEDRTGSFKRKLNPQGIIDQQTYLFKDYAQYKDKIFETVIECAKECKLPATISQETFKAGGMFLGSTSKMLCIDGGYAPFIVVNVRTCGTYLFVTSYLLIEESWGNKFIAKHTNSSLGDLAYFGQDLISVSGLQSFCATAKAVLEESFARLELEEYKSGFFGI